MLPVEVICVRKSAWACIQLEADWQPGLVQEYSPLLGQAGSRDRTNQEGKRVPALKDLWMGKVTSSSTLTLPTRVLRLLHHIMTTALSSKAAFQHRTSLVDSALSGAALPTGDCFC